jgi:hypothetical protein
MAILIIIGWMAVIIAIEQYNHKQASELPVWARLNYIFFRILLALACLINFFFWLFFVLRSVKTSAGCSLLANLFKMLKIETGSLACKPNDLLDCLI